MRCCSCGGGKFCSRKPFYGFPHRPRILFRRVFFFIPQREPPVLYMASTKCFQVPLHNDLSTGFFAFLFFYCRLPGYSALLLNPIRFFSPSEFLPTHHFKAQQQLFHASGEAFIELSFLLRVPLPISSIFHGNSFVFFPAVSPEFTVRSIWRPPVVFPLASERDGSSIGNGDLDCLLRTFVVLG